MNLPGKEWFGRSAEIEGEAEVGAGMPPSHALSRWPTVEEVRANYLREGYPCAHALIVGFSDYHPTVVSFNVGGTVHEPLVHACFYDRFHGFVRDFNQQDGIRLTWLEIPANDQAETRPSASNAP